MNKYTTDKEVWKDIEGYEGLYRVSDKGRVKSLARTVRMHGYDKFTKDVVMKNHVSPNGYATVNLSKDGKRKTSYIHRLVSKAFIANPKRYNEVNHKDEDKLNNKVSNLEWCTHKQNMNHGTVMRRVNSHANTVKSKSEGLPVVGINVKDGSVIEFLSGSEAGRKGFDQGAISRCINGVYKTHKGYKWEYRK